MFHADFINNINLFYSTRAAIINSHLRQKWDFNSDGMQLSIRNNIKLLRHKLNKKWETINSYSNVVSQSDKVKNNVQTTTNIDFINDISGAAKTEIVRGIKQTVISAKL